MTVLSRIPSQSINPVTNQVTQVLSGIPSQSIGDDRQQLLETYPGMSFKKPKPANEGINKKSKNTGNSFLDEVSDTVTKLTPKQEKFCLVYLETGNASEAYRQAYNASKQAENTINNNAYKLLQKNEILTRLTELRKPILEKSEITREGQIAKLNHIYNLALAPSGEDGTLALPSAVRALEVQNKMLGLDAPTKIELTGDEARPIVITKIIVNQDPKKI